MQWIPTSSAEVFPFGGGANTRKTPADTVPTATVEDTRVSNQEISVSLASSFNIGAIFSGSVGSNEVGYWLDAMAYTDRYEEIFAMRRIREGSSVKDALAHGSGKYDESVVRAVYRKIAPGLQDTEAPPKNSKDKAKQWLG